MKDVPKIIEIYGKVKDLIKNHNFKEIWLSVYVKTAEIITLTILEPVLGTKVEYVIWILKKCWSIINAIDLPKIKLCKMGVCC